MLTMEALKAHALKNPEKLFPLGNCDQCLAADMTGKTMAGHDRFVGDAEPALPRAFVSFTRGVTTARAMQYGEPRRLDTQGTLTGAQIARALEAIEAGADPYLTGSEAWLNAGETK